MKLVVPVFLFSLMFTGDFSIDITDRQSKSNDIVVDGIYEKSCSQSFGGDVATYTLRDGKRDVGHSIWISRKSKKAKAKYFAHKEGVSHVHQRYTNWKKSNRKNVILKSSGAYATGWNSSAIPVGITVDNGVLVNQKLDKKMNALVIVYATGGIVVSNVKDGNLYLGSLKRTVNINNSTDRTLFLQWAKKEKATVFQTHLMAYKGKLNVGKYNSKKDKARRKLFTLAKSRSGELFHVIHYFNKPNYTLYNSTSLVLDYLKGKNMEVIAMVNLDTGGYDILDTEGGAKNCRGLNIWGTSKKYNQMTNLLTYEYY